MNVKMMEIVDPFRKNISDMLGLMGNEIIMEQREV